VNINHEKTQKRARKLNLIKKILLKNLRKRLKNYDLENLKIDLKSGYPLEQVSCQVGDING